MLKKKFTPCGLVAMPATPICSCDLFIKEI